MSGPRIPLWELQAEHLRDQLPGTFQAKELLTHVEAVLARCERRGLQRGSPAFQAASWSILSRELLSPSLPWALHELLYQSAFATWDDAAWGPPPVWTPAPGQATETNIGVLLRNHGNDLLGSQWTSMTSPAQAFPALQRVSYDNPELYWPKLLSELGIVFHQRPLRMLDPTAKDPGTGAPLPGGMWLPGASLNIAESCLLPPANGKRRDDRVAVVWREEGEEAASAPLPLGRRTLAQVRELAYHVAAGLVSLGLGHGAAVAVFLPMTADSVSAYLGIILAGSTVVSVAESFSTAELASRLKIAGARGIITQDIMVRGGKAIPLYSRVVEAQGPTAIVLQSPGAGTRPLGSDARPVLRDGDVTFEQLLERGKQRVPHFTPPAMPSDFPCNILFSSGTTGTPKAIPWSQATPVKAAADALLHQDIRAGDVVAWPTSLGWMMGPWLIFAALVNGATVALYQGSPGTRGFMCFVQDARVTMLGVIPSLVRAWRALSSTSSTPLDWTSIRAFSSTGEASTPPDALWLMSRACYRAPVLEYCGGTEIGGAFATGTLVQPQALSCFSTAAMGCRVAILEQGTQLPMPEDRPCTGECALMPRMLGASWKLLNADNFAVYFKGMPVVDGQVLRRHGDAFERLPGGYFKAHGRIDDTMNLGGIKVSSVEIERECNLAHLSVVETAAIGKAPSAGGPEELLVFAVLKPGGHVQHEHLKEAFTQQLRRKLNPLFRVSRVVLVHELPRTATNKVLRRQLRDGVALLDKNEMSNARSRL